jgi:hypothetical protein
LETSSSIRVAAVRPAALSKALLACGKAPAGTTTTVARTISGIFIGSLCMGRTLNGRQSLYRRFLVDKTPRKAKSFIVRERNAAPEI